MLLLEEKFLELAQTRPRDMNPLILLEMKSLLDRNVNINVESESYNTALMLSQTYDVTDFLLEQNANPNCVDKKLRTALQIRCLFNDYDGEETYKSILSLVHHGAYIDSLNLLYNPLYLLHAGNAQNYKGPLRDYFFLNGVSGKELLKLAISPAFIDITAHKLCCDLIESGVDPNIYGANGRTPLLHFCVIDCPLTYKIINLSTPKFLNATSFGCSALASACSVRQVNIVKALLQRGANPDIGKVGDRSPLASVASITNFFTKDWDQEEERLEIARLLLQAGADVNLTHSEFTPLMLARNEKFIEMEELLYSCGRKP